MIPLEALRQHLVKERENGAPTAILFAQVALFSTSLFLHKTNFTSKHDKQGTKTALFYQIIALLLRYSKFLSRLKFLKQGTCGYKVNTIANLTCLVLAIIFDNLYEKSFASLGVVLSIAVLVLVLLIIIKPRSDLGFLGFLIGVAGSIASNRYKLGYRTWVVGSICFVIFGFKCWLDKNWLQLEEDQMPPPLLPTTSTSTSSSSSIQGNETISSKSKSSEIIEALIVIGCYLYWDQYLLRTNCPNSVIVCVKKSVPSVVVLGLCSSLAIALRLHTLAKIRFHFNAKLENKVDDDDIMIIKSEEQDADAAPVLLTTDTLKQRHKQRFLKVVLKLDVEKKSKHKAMKIVSTLPGVDSIAMDMKDKKMTVIGDVDPLVIVQKLKKVCYTELLSIGPAKEPKKKEEILETEKSVEEQKNTEEKEKILTEETPKSVEEQKNTEEEEKILTETLKEEE